MAKRALATGNYSGAADSCFLAGVGGGGWVGGGLCQVGSITSMASPSLSNRVVHLTVTLGLVATLEVELMGLRARLAAVDEELPFRCLGNLGDIWTGHASTAVHGCFGAS